MGKEIIRFGDIEIKRLNFHCNKNTTFQKDVDIDSILAGQMIELCCEYLSVRCI